MCFGETAVFIHSVVHLTPYSSNWPTVGGNIKSVNILENQELLENDDSHLKSLHKNVVATSFDLLSIGHYRQAHGKYGNLLAVLVCLIAGIRFSGYTV